MMASILRPVYRRLHWLVALVAKMFSRTPPLPPRRLPVELLYELVQSTPFEQCARLAFGANCVPLAVFADKRHKKLAAKKLAVLQRQSRDTSLPNTNKKLTPMERAIKEFSAKSADYVFSSGVIGASNLHISGAIKHIAVGNFEASGNRGTNRCFVECALTYCTVSPNSIAFWKPEGKGIWRALAILPVERQMGIKYDKGKGEVRWTRSDGRRRLCWKDRDAENDCSWTQLRLRLLQDTDFDELLTALQSHVAVPNISHLSEDIFHEGPLVVPVPVMRIPPVADVPQGQNPPPPQHQPGQNPPPPQHQPGQNPPPPQHQPGQNLPPPQHQPGQNLPPPQHQPGQNLPPPEQHQPVQHQPLPQHHQQHVQQDQLPHQQQVGGVEEIIAKFEALNL